MASITTRSWNICGNKVRRDGRSLNQACEVREHIGAQEIEVRYAERLNDVPETPYESIRYDSVGAIYATHDRAMELLISLLDKDVQFWETVLEMKTRSTGILRATRRTTFVHLPTHTIRHYAQLASLVRREGLAPGFEMDYIMMHRDL